MPNITELDAPSEAFALAVASGHNRTTAALMAFPRARHWTRATVHVWSHKKYQDPDIRRRIAEIQRELIEDAKVEVHQVVTELAKVALFDVRTLFDEEGRLRPVAEWDDSAAAAVSSIKRHANGTIEVKLNDKNAAAEKLMKHLGGYQLDNQQKGDPVATFLASMGRSALPVSSAGPAQALPTSSALPVATDELPPEFG